MASVGLCLLTSSVLWLSSCSSGHAAVTEPLRRETVTGEPVTEEPVTEESVTEESVPEESVPEESVPEESVPEEPVTQQSDTQRPFLKEIVPDYGPVSGGTAIFLNGGGLPPGTGNERITVRIGEHHRCNVSQSYSSNLRIACVTEPMKSTVKSIVNMEQDVTVIIHDGQRPQRVQPSLTFTYRPDPIITNMNPHKTILHGGINITFTGRNMDSINKSRLLVLRLVEVPDWKQERPEPIGECPLHNSTMMVCIAPKINPHSRQKYSNDRKRRRRAVRIATHDYTADVGLLLDGVETYRNLTDHFGRLEMHPNPTLGTPRPQRFRPYRGDQILEIEGERLSDGCRKKDYSVWLNAEHGEECKQSCPVVKLYRNQITCRPPETLTCNRKTVYVMVEVGYYNATLHEPVTYENSIVDDPMFWPGLAGAASALIVIVLAYFYCKRRRRRKQTKKEEFELLKRRCMDYEALIQKESDDANEFLNLLSTGMREKLRSALINGLELDIQEEIGQGNFGRVYRGSLYRREQQKVVAVKTLKHEAVENRELEEFLEEATIMMDFHHPNVISLLGVVLKKGRVYVLLPFMAKGDLKNYIGKTSYNFITFTKYSSDVAKGMAYLAEQKFIHRDLATRNCMVDAADRVVVADFGLARNILEKDYYRPDDKRRPLPWKWMALETLHEGRTFNTKSDVWSFGVLMWEIFTQGRKPYERVMNEDLRKHLEDGRRLEKPENCPDAVWNVMWPCWRRNADERPSFANIVDDLEKIIEQYSGDTMVRESKVYQNDPKRQQAQNIRREEQPQQRMHIRYTLTPTNSILPQKDIATNLGDIDAGYFTPVEPGSTGNPTNQASRTSRGESTTDQQLHQSCIKSMPNDYYTEALQYQEPEYVNQDGHLVQSEYLTSESPEDVTSHDYCEPLPYKEPEYVNQDGRLVQSMYLTSESMEEVTSHDYCEPLPYKEPEYVNQDGRLVESMYLTMESVGDVMSHDYCEPSPYKEPEYINQDGRLDYCEPSPYENPNSEEEDYVVPTPVKQSISHTQHLERGGNERLEPLYINPDIGVLIEDTYVVP